MAYALPPPPSDLRALSGYEPQKFTMAMLSTRDFNGWSHQVERVTWKWTVCRVSVSKSHMQSLRAEAVWSR